MSRANEDIDLARELEALASRGIRADAQPLKEDMCSQFADADEWIREYVANAYDAGARRVAIEVSECPRGVMVTVADDGHGMNGAAFQDFFTVFRSSQRDVGRTAVGHHGVGKLSVGAVPGQLEFHVITSTGAEAWRADLARILDVGPITLHRVEPAPARGTRFDMVFDGKRTATEVTSKLTAVLQRYIRFLPLDIELWGGRGAPVRLGAETWTTGLHARRYRFQAGRTQCDAVLAMAPESAHEVYQGRVLVAAATDVISHGRAEPLPCRTSCSASTRTTSSCPSAATDCGTRASSTRSVPTCGTWCSRTTWSRWSTFTSDPTRQRPPGCRTWHASSSSPKIAGSRCSRICACCSTCGAGPVL